MLAIINVLENRLNFFSLALNSKVTRVKVIPAKRSNRNGQNRVIIPEVEKVTAKPKTARAAVKIIRLRKNLFNNSFILTGVLN